MNLTRRDFGKVALAAVPAAGLLAADKPNSLFNGVQIGVITYSYRTMPDQSAEAYLKYIVDSGVSAIELMGDPAESFAGRPAQPRRGGRGQELTAEQRAEMESARKAVKDWRLSVPMDKFKELRKMYKAEDLASVTADLVIKRSMRILDLQKRQLGIMQGMARRILGFDIELMRQMMTQSLESMQLELARMQSVQEHGRIMRETSLVSAKAAREQYGVVFDDKRNVDAAKTQALRASMRAARHAAE